MALLHVIIIFSPEGQHVVARQLVSNIQDKYLVLLKHYLESKYMYSRAAEMYPQLMAKMKELKELAEVHGKHLLDVNPREIEPIMLEILIGLGMVCLTTLIQGFFMVIGARIAEWRAARSVQRQHEFRKALAISLLTAWLLIGVILEVLVWAAVYLALPEITKLSNLETAFYFSMVTFTTLGYGDLVLDGSWRILASLQAANGAIIIGWTTALIFFFIGRIYSNK